MNKSERLVSCQQLFLMMARDRGAKNSCCQRIRKSQRSEKRVNYPRLVKSTVRSEFTSWFVSIAIAKGMDNRMSFHGE